MPDPKQPIFIPFDHGVDTRNHKRMVRPPYLLAANNVYLNRDTGLQKRTGLASLPQAIVGGGSVTRGANLFAFRDELLLCDEGYLYSYADAARAWSRRGTLLGITTTLRPAAATATSQTQAAYVIDATQQFEAAVCGNVFGGGVLVVSSRQSKAVLATLLLPNGVNNPRLIASATTVLLVYGNSSLAARRLTFLPTPALGPEYVIASGIPDTVSWDVATNGTVIAAAYNTGAGWTVQPLTDAGARVPAASTTLFPVVGSTNGTASPCLAFSPGATLFVLVNRDATNLYSRIGDIGSGSAPLEQTVAVPSGYTGFFNTGAVFYAGLPVLFAEAQASQTLMPTPPYVLLDIMRFDILAGAFTYTGLTSRASAFLARPFIGRAMDGTSDIYFFCTNVPCPTQPTTFLYNATRQILVGRMAYGTTDTSKSISTSALTNLPQVIERPVSGHYAYSFGQLKRVQIRSYGKTLSAQSAVHVFEAEFGSVQQLPSARLGAQQHIGGSLVQSYDGAALAENNFLLAPDIQVMQQPITTGGYASGVTVSAVACFEWVDAQGQMHRSAPSAPATFVTTSANACVDIYVLPMFASNKSGATTVVYATLGNGTVYYRVTGYDQAPAAVAQPAQGQPTARSTGYASMAANEILYTVGGELENDAPNGTALMVQTKNRLLTVDNEQTDTINYSKQAVLGAGASFSLGLQKRIATLPGPITALAAVDDKIIVFKGGGILVFGGTGPNAAGVTSGLNDDFSEPQIITTEITCQNAASILTTGDGIYFQSPTKGTWLLTRGLQLVYVGAPVEAYNGQVTTSAQQVPLQSHIRFGASTGPTLVYHYRALSAYGATGQGLGAWTTYSSYAHAAACTWRGSYAIVRPSGQVSVEGTGYLDDAEPIVQTLTTAWITAGPPGSVARIAEMAVLGEFYGPHTLQMDCSVGFVDAPAARSTVDSAVALATSTWGVDTTWGAGTSYGGDAYHPYIVRMREIPAQQAPAGAVQWTLTDAPSHTGTATMGNTLSIHGLLLMVDPLAGVLRAPVKLSV